MQPDRRPVPLDKYDVLACSDPVQIEQHPAFLEFRRQLVALFTVRHVVTGPAPGIGNELAALIMDRDTDPPGHAAAAAEAEPKQFDEFGAEPMPLKIRVRRIKLQRERQGRVYRLVRGRRSVARHRFGLGRRFRCRLGVPLFNARSAFSSLTARRGDWDLADAGQRERGGPEIIRVALDAGDEFEHIALRAAAEAVKNFPLQLDLARGFALSVKRTQHRAVFSRACSL